MGKFYSLLIENPDEIPEMAAKFGSEQQVDIGDWLRIKLGRFVHPFTHTWIPMKTYSRPADRLIEAGRVCYYCQRWT